MSKIFLRYANNDATYSVQWVDAYAFGFHRFKSAESINVKNFPSLREKYCKA
jgi:hypothetical protein